MKTFRVTLLSLFLGGMSLALPACTAVTSLPLATVFGGAQLAIKGAELQEEIRKADVQEAFDSPFERTWNWILTALGNLRIEITKTQRNEAGDGGIIEAQAEKIKVRIVLAKVTENITEIGIWAGHDNAFARLIVEEIKGERQKQDKRPEN